MITTLVLPIAATLVLLAALIPFVAIKEDDVIGVFLAAGVFLGSGPALFLGTLWIAWRRERLVERYVRLALAIGVATAALLATGLHLIGPPDPDETLVGAKLVGAVVFWMVAGSLLYFCVLLIPLLLLGPLRWLDAIARRITG